MADEHVAVAVNGLPLTDLTIGNVGWGQYTFDLPAQLIPTDGLLTLTFTADRAQSTFERTQGEVDDKRLLAVAYDSIQFERQP